MINFSECIDKNNTQQDVTLFNREDELGRVQELLSEHCEEKLSFNPGSASLPNL